MSYQHMMTIAERIEPNAEPDLILDDTSAAWVAYCLIYDAATEELLGKTCPPPEHLRESLLRLADECLWTPWELNDTWDEESLFDACLDQWTEWYEYGILKEYCRRWNLGELPDHPEPEYTGSFKDAWNYHTTHFRKSFEKSPD